MVQPGSRTLNGETQISNGGTDTTDPFAGNGPVNFSCVTFLLLFLAYEFFET